MEKGHPVEAACQEFSMIDGDSAAPEIFDAMLNAAKIFYGEGCFDPFEEQNFENNPYFGWNILECTDLLFPIGQDGPLNMFPVKPWDQNAWIEHCKDEYNISTRPYSIDNYFGGTHPTDLLGYSNVFFVNGQLDPWHNFGLLESLTDSIVAFYIPDSAHQYDLRFPNPSDPASLIEARDLERYWIAEFIQQKKELASSLGNLVSNSTLLPYTYYDYYSQETTPF